MHRHDGDVAAALVRQHRCRYVVGGITLRRISDQPHSGPVELCRPRFGNAAGCRRNRADEHPMLAVRRHHGWAVRGSQVGSSPDALDPRPGESRDCIGQPRVAEIENVVVGQGAHVGP